MVTAATIAKPWNAIFQNGLTLRSVKPSSITPNEEHPEDRSEHGSDAAEDVDAADHDRGDDVELEPDPEAALTFAKPAPYMNPPSPARAPLIVKARRTRRPTGMPE